MEQHDSHVKLYYHLWQHTSRKDDGPFNYSYKPVVDRFDEAGRRWSP